MIRAMAKLSVPVYAHCVVRPFEEQLRVFLDGHSKVDPRKSAWAHQAFAVDIIHSGKAWALDDYQWLVVGHVGKELAKAMGLAVTWGGDWKPNANGVGWDPAHWELTGWKAEADAFPFPALTKWEKGWRKKVKALQAVIPS